MGASIHAHLSAAAMANPIAAAFVGIAACLGLIFLITQEIFKPVGKRRPPRGKKWKLPPGPRGVPIFGNLLYLRKVREDGERRIVSSCPYSR